MRILRNQLYLSILPVIAIIISACGGDGRTTAEIQAEHEAAARLGREQALRLIPSEHITDSIAMEATLIDVRVRETALRNEGEDELADTYIGSFLATLDSVNPSLADELSAADASILAAD